MKALLALKSAINQSTVLATLALISLISVIYPEVSLAASLQTGEQNALVFEVKNPSSIQKTENTQALSYDSVLQSDPLVIKLKAYLTNYNSPLADYAPQIVDQPNWEKAIAISYVESNMGVHCFDNNCSGIGVKPGHAFWRKYTTKLDWFKDMCKLLDKPIYTDKY